MSDATSEAKKEAEGERKIAPENQSRSEATNAILAAIASMAGEVRDFKRDVTERLDEHDEEFRSMRRAIHGTSKAPPPNDEGGAMREKQPSIADMAKAGSVASGDVAELKGQLIAVRAELAKQSKSMGIGRRGLDWLFSATGGKTIVRLLTLAGAAYAALHASGH
jgi:hypothetical protein